MQKEDITKRVKLLFMTRRNTQLTDIVNYDLPIMEISRRTGIKSARLYRIFDIPTKAELDAIEGVLDVMKIEAEAKLRGDLEMLGPLTPGGGTDIIARALSQSMVGDFTSGVEIDLAADRLNKGGFATGSPLSFISDFPEGSFIPLSVFEKYFKISPELGKVIEAEINFRNSGFDAAKAKKAFEDLDQRILSGEAEVSAESPVTNNQSLVSDFGSAQSPVTNNQSPVTNQEDDK